ncbi:MAG: RecQ family ATP-dependent DNA helicase [Anaerolineales bacterium]|nr:RecQ family ATP-dependent DNA helicase [Anaerolineales bacterium]
MNSLFSNAKTLLKLMVGENCDFRPGQWEAIEAIASKKLRVLVVQRTGWGKSLVYFLATKLLREQGSGSTLLISPLLSLMRNQIEMANKIGIQAFTINSANRDEWETAEAALSNNECDILLISPERLNNERFQNSILPRMAGRVGLFVVDEAHCISDWGHDFRPDYRRIVRIIQMLPKGVPILGTTATANDRVIEDIQHQIGKDLKILRGSLDRETLRLQNIRLTNQSERMAWLVENLPKFQGSGIIYCLTVPDTQRVAEWLKSNGFIAEAYHAGNDNDIDRPALEQAFLNNEIQILVATVALGMGFDKPDISFVIHFQRPGSVIAYYQQVGRAGRAVDRAYGILLSGVEDEEIQDYFIKTAFPSVESMREILDTLERYEALPFSELLSKVNISWGMTEKALKMLEVDGAVGTTYNKKLLFFRTPNPWQPDTKRIERVIGMRNFEKDQMQEYLDHKGCLMEYLLKALDDPYPRPCGRCANCHGRGLPRTVSNAVVIKAENFLKGLSIPINPRKRLSIGLFPDEKRVIPNELQNSIGRSLCYYGDAGWGKLVRDGKYTNGHFAEELVEASLILIQNHWIPDPPPRWLTSIPSRRHPTLVSDFAKRLASKLGIPFLPVLIRIEETPEQKLMQNSTMQAQNVVRSLSVEGFVPAEPVLLIDDIVDSGWTLTIAGYLLQSNGCGQVYPFTLAQATSRNIN